MPMGAGFFEKARADSETWDLGLATNEGKLEEQLVVGQLKLAKLRFPPYETSSAFYKRLVEFTKLCFL